MKEESAEVDGFLEKFMEMSEIFKKIGRMVKKGTRIAFEPYNDPISVRIRKGWVEREGGRREKGGGRRDNS